MQVAENKVVTMQYTLTNDTDEVLDQSSADEPLEYLHGAGNIIPGLEKELNGKQVGDNLKVRINPEEAYGERDESMVQTMPKSSFQGIDKVESGMEFHAQGNQGTVTVMVTKVEGEQITVDGNHPLAGVALTFAVEITDVREPTADELQHGHVHGAGCQHD